MNLSWYLARLRNMEAAEVMHRITEKARKVTSRHQHQGWERYSLSDLHPVFPAVSERMRQASPLQRTASARASGAILAGRYQALGRQWPHIHDQDLFPQSLWRLDPVTGHSWPGSDTYCFDIDFRHDGTRGDVKYVWEINRLQFLVALSAHFLLTEHTGSLAAVEAAISSWHAANPPFRGVSWASGIEVALRAISLVLVVEILGTHLSADARAKISQILAASAFWLARFPSRFSSANNHLVAELTGEYLIARALGQAGSASWTALLAELEKQILPDGGGAEQTPSYAAFTAELVLIAVLAAREAGHKLSAASSQRLADFDDFLGWIGPGARFGDDDEGRVVTLGDEVDYPSSIAAAIAAFLGKVSPVGRVEDFRALIFGPAPAGVIIPQGLRTFAATGFSVWRGEVAQRQVVLRFDHGPLGYLSIAAHGHADALSITLDLDGQPILVDPGTFLYGSGGVWRDWFRSTPAHNTLNLGASQSVMSGAFNWSHKASARLLTQSDGVDWELAAEHDGYEKRFGVRHRRILKREGASLSIRDCLVGKAQEGEIVFQLAPGLETESNRHRVLVSSRGQPLIEITLPDENFEIRAGGNSPGEGGWVSNRFGSKLPASRIAWRGKVDETGVWSRVSVLPPLTKL